MSFLINRNAGKRALIAGSIVSLSIGLLSGCTTEELSEDLPHFSGKVLSVDSHGALKLDFTTGQLQCAGFLHGDILHIRIGDSIVQDIPYVTDIDVVGAYSSCICDYGKQSSSFCITMSHASFASRVGGKGGDPIVITLKERGGYQAMCEQLQAESNARPLAEPDHAAYANFREVMTTGIACGVLYRSSNPLYAYSDERSCYYADSLAQEAGIQSELDLENTDVKIEAYHDRCGLSIPYSYSLYTDHRVLALGLPADPFDEEYKAKWGEGLRFLLKQQPPCLIHCNTGRERTGFVAMLLEALTGAAIAEMERDYMESYVNTSYIQAGSTAYDTRRTLTFDRILWLLVHPESLSRGAQMDWTDLTVTADAVQQAARRYLMECGLTASECDDLYRTLTTGSR